MAVPYTFGTATASIPLSQLDSNFATVITLGNTAIQLGNTVTTLNNMTLANVTISSGNITLTNVSATTANVTTANVVTMIITGNETVQGNTTVTGTITGAKLIPTGSSVTGNGMYLPATNSVGISTNGTNAVYIDASQNVGIGTSSPSTYAKLVSTTGDNATTFAAVGATNMLRVQGYNSTYVGTVLEAVNLAQSANTPLFINGSTLKFGISGTTQATIDSSGNVGIGTNSPARKLDVRSSGGTVFANVGNSGSDNNGAGITFTGSSTTKNWFIGNQFNVTGAFEFTQTTANGGTSPAATPSMVIDSSGNLLVGTTSQNRNWIAKSNASGYAITLENSSATSPNVLQLYLSGVTGGTGQSFINATDNNATRFVVAGNGNVTNTNNSYGAISDVKLKENIVDATPKLVDLMQVKIRNYNLIGETTKQIGVVAQELEQVFPNMVVELADKDADNNDVGTTTKSVKYSVFVPILIKCIQEQQALITSLTARIEALEAK